MDKPIERCEECAGKGYFEYKTGVVSPHIPYEEEVAKEPCDCIISQYSKGEDTPDA